jgi:class 3 adenylate cyclase/tetratricopeptide (TPR) repeat protein
VNCVTCGAHNTVGSKFCGQCGSKLEATCANCASPLREEARFCAECGTPVAGAKNEQPTQRSAAAPAPTEAVAERRLVTVLFADLVGFTSFAEERDAEEVRDTLSRYFELAKDVVGRYGGTIEKFIGDAVMAVWGAPTAHEDDAERAVRAALDLVEEVHAVAPGIQLRAGLLTGEAVVTLGATDQGMVAGDIVNTASRLQSVAPAGTALVGEATYRAASKAIVFEPVGDQLLKGKVAPVPAWRALRVVAERGGRNRSASVEAPFVGRESELRLLKDMLHATSREQRARLVSITGIAGIGKSRLAWEFEKYLDGLVENIRWHSGRSPSYGEGLTFWALGEIVRSRAGLQESEDEEATRAKVASSVAEWVPDETERAWIEPALLALLGAGEPPPGGRENLFAAWRTFFERIAARDVVMMVFEDLHWADAGLLDFIDHLLEWSRDLPICIVTLARPELLERRPDWGAGKRNFTAITLGPLDEPQMDELLAGLVPGLPSRTVGAIVARAEGIPLYAVEMVRVLVAEGKLIEVEGRYRPAGDLDDIAVPETLQALIAARLDTLDPADRALLQDAAVLGQSFTPAGLAAVSGIGRDELEPRLRGLVRREVLGHKVDPRSPERGQYSFVQALIHEVAYKSLAKPERRARHLAAARWVESLGEDELAGALASHYLSAYRSTLPGPEADALAVQARIALKAAGDRAAQLGSHEQALAFYDQALSVCSDLVERVDLLRRGALAATVAGRHDDAERRARQAFELEREQGDQRAVADATATLGLVLLNAYRTPEALEVLQPAYHELADLDDPALIALGGQMARAHFFAEQDSRALEVADRVLAAAEHANLLPIITDTMVTKGSALANQGRAREGAGLLRAALALAEENGLADLIFRATVNLVAVEMAHNPLKSLEIARRGMAAMSRMGRPHVPTLAGNLGDVAMRVGEWQAALVELDRVVERRLDPIDWVQTYSIRISLRLLMGIASDDEIVELEQAARAIDNKEAELSRRIVACWRTLINGEWDQSYDGWLRAAGESALNAADALAIAARLALWQGDAQKARRALDLLDATGQHGPALDTVRRCLDAGLLALSGRRAEARPIYREVLRVSREMSLRLDEVFTAIDMLSTLGRDDPDAQAAAVRAREVLDELGGSPLARFLESPPPSAPARQTQPAEPSQQAPVVPSAGA